MTSVEVILLIIARSGHQELLRVLGVVGDGVSIHDTHVMNNVRPLHP